ncbi:hypothetical protein MNBD_GAMMA18-1584 [hydrothermal vent metagenome]|uniref:Uncharacterized protein n=1 Tax=hydrothermal vent metagenome TaxID=652676 RepID=A0A3B0ZSN9_9ZZZZ
MTKFETMWKNYPDKEKIKSMCTNKQSSSNKPFSDYCAIMMSECFIRSSIDMSSFSGNKCWSHSGKKHILLADDLANSLNRRRPPGFGNMEKINTGAFQEALKGRTGVIFFKDYWQRGKESFEHRSGDHIDLWNSNEISNSSMFYRSLVEFLGIVSDLNKSKEIWFWSID